MHGMNLYEHTDYTRWTAGELNKIESMVGFDSLEDMQKAACHLLQCHRHHFAVLPDSGYKLAVSADAMECLKLALATGRWLKCP